MKKIVLAALAATTALIATPAAAQVVTGTVNVTGTVVGRCSVVQVGGAPVQTFGGTIGLGTLDDPDGTLRDNLQSSTSVAPADGLSVNTRVVCTSANPTVEISATNMVTGAGTAGINGYSDNIDYTAQVAVNVAAGGVVTTSYNTFVGGAATSQQLGGPIAAGAADNVHVSVYGLAAENGPTSTLVAGSYLGVITVTITAT